MGGKPLIVWTLNAALESLAFDEIVLSSDDPEILGHAHDFNAIPLKRPAEMATDEASPYPAILHALDHFHADHVCLLQPTSPFRTAFDINYALAVYLNARQYQYVHLASVETPTIPNGAIYIGFRDWLRNGGNFDADGIGTDHKGGFALNRLAYQMPPARSIDIDTEEHWAQAEAML